MSTDASTHESGERAAPDCTLCAGRAGAGSAVAVQTYASGEVTVPTHAERDGFLGLCTACATDLEELVTAWDARDPPPVGRTDAIATDYAVTAECCGFCGDAVDVQEALTDDQEPPSDDQETPTDDQPPVLGVELYRPGTDWRRNYLLCPDCGAVFDEFLAGVAADATGD